MTPFWAESFGHHVGEMRAVGAKDLLASPVRLHGIELGRPVDVLLDREELRAVGLDVLCRDEVHRFLPLPTAIIGEGEIVIRSPLVLLEEDELSFYRERAFALSDLRGASVELDGRPVGVLRELVIESSGRPVQVVLDVDGVERSVPFDESVRFRPRSRSAA